MKNIEKEQMILHPEYELPHTFVEQHKESAFEYYSRPALPLTPDEIKSENLVKLNEEDILLYANDKVKIHIDENGRIIEYWHREDDTTSYEGYEYDSEGYITKHDIRSLHDSQPSGSGVYIRHYYDENGSGEKTLNELFFTYYHVNKDLTPNQYDRNKPPVRINFDRT